MERIAILLFESQPSFPPKATTSFLYLPFHFSTREKKNKTRTRFYLEFLLTLNTHCHFSKNQAQTSKLPHLPPTKKKIEIDHLPEVFLPLPPLLFCPTLPRPHPSSHPAEGSWQRYKASHSSDDSCLTRRQPAPG